MTAKLPWMPFYGADFFESEEVALMSNAERGMWLTLLWRQWREGSLPFDRPSLAKLVGEQSLPELVWRCFPLSSDNRRRNPRLEEIRAEQDAYRERQSHAGRMGALKRWHGDPNSTAIATPMAPPIAQDSKPKPELKLKETSSSSSARARFLADGMEPDGQSALEGYCTASREPERFLGELEALHSGMHGPGGLPVPLPALGRALHAMRLAGIINPTPNTIRGFCRKELEPERPANGGPPEDDTHARLERWAQRKAAERARNQ